jgi:hypothetical protein
MLVVIAGLLLVGLVGFLFFSPCGVTIEKFQNPSSEPAPALAPESEPEPVLAPVAVPTAVPVPSVPVPAVPVLVTKQPRPPTVPVKTAPVAPTPASSAAALSLTPVQCSALCPVTLETCEGKFSCQTKLTPIGNTPLSMTSTPAPAK